MADEIVEAQRAQAFLDQYGSWLHRLRETYKERLAEIFESGAPDRDAEIARLGSKLAVFGDFVNDLGQTIANAEMRKDEA